MDGINRYFQPNTLDGLSIYESILPGEPLYVDGSNAMQADANMGGHNVKNVANATTADEAVNLGQLTTSLATKADTSYVNSQLALKADTSYVNSQLALKADTTYVNSQLALKADLTYVNSQLSLKANDSAVVHLGGAESISGVKSFTALPTSSITATLPSQFITFGQVTSAISTADANVVHLTGNETIGGIKTFSSSPVVPSQPTTLTQATSQKMVASLRPVSWCHKMYCMEQTTPSVFGTVTYTRQVAYSPFEIGSFPLAQRDVGGGGLIQELWISSSVMHAGLPLTGIILRASNYRNPFGSLHQRPQIRVGIWDPDTGAIQASSITTNLKLQTAPSPGSTVFENFYVPFQTNFTPATTKRYVYGIWWEVYEQFITTANVFMTTQVNNADLFQTGYTGNSQASAYKTGVTTFPTTLPAPPYTVYTAGLFCMFVTFDSSAVW